uniref:Reverse transcriptase domain-containing protein n=1 Tax=Gouania willdenowi TaxID=441366 RepID=A0A8C5G154_GOUWI
SQKSFIQWVYTLYTKSKASVTTNKITFPKLQTPLSPLLFAIFVEPLAADVRQNSVIKGIHSSISEHKINLYADDILLYLDESQSSLEEVFNLINSFSKLSGYSINWSKSISSNLNELIKLNLDPIASVKINYLFSMIPLKPPTQRFKRLDSAITKFYARNKKPKISLSTLQKNINEGGLEAPNFMHYYLANQILYLTEWLKPKDYYNTWLEIEQLDYKHIKLSDLLFITTTLKCHNCFNNPLIASTLTAWWKTLDIMNIQLKTSMLSPIWHNPHFRNRKNRPI